MPRGNSAKSPHNGSLETSWNTLFEGSKPVLKEAPARLDRTEFARVGRQRCSAIRGRHRDVAARLVDENQPVRRDAFDLFEECGALLLDVVPELLRRAEPFFVSPRLAAANAACLID